jgi:23S rRNA (pseudouridine1915-N3)-methyltransferase
MTLKIVSVGKKHEDWVASGIERYQKRLRGPFSIEWVLLPPSGADEPRARQDESERIQKLLRATDYVILLDERGKNIDSPALASLLTTQFNASKSIVIIIGGAYGVDESLRSRADFSWSLSALVFPHQLVRLILTEQVYRAQEIENGGGYHHS